MYDLSIGKVMNALTLEKNLYKLPFTDAWIVNSSSTNLTYTIMTNQALIGYENNKEQWRIKAK